jgi:phosphate acyltransferase
LRIGIDLMGGDTPPEVLFEGVLLAAAQLDTSFTYVVLATPEVIGRLASSSKESRIEIYPTPDLITMSDEPLPAVRHKRGSSLVVGIRLLKKRHLDAFISAGNTGALIVAATLYLPLLPGIKRPALLALLPTDKGSVAVIDVGGNVSCKAHHLVQFAQMGANYQRSSQNIAQPRVGLLNIGVESQKGTQEVRQAYQILHELGPESGMNFVGNVEAREVLQGNIDVLVTDGFSGNVLLKSIEGASTFILHFLSQRLSPSGTPLLKERLNELYAQFSSDEYPGAILCGIEGVVVKCHGNASPRAFFNSIKVAQNQV